MKDPFTLSIDVQRQAWETAADFADKSQVAPDRAETLDEVEVGQTPSETVYEENKLELLHYEPQTDEQHDVPILITYALINRPYILDLQPNRSVVRTLLKQGFDVYLVDWGEPSIMDASLTLEDYVTRYIDNCVDVVRERSGRDEINLLGYCMGGTMSAMYAALYPEKVRNLGLMAAGLCFENSGGVLELWGGNEHFDPEEITETFGNVPAEFLDVGFQLMDPVENYVTKYVRLYDNIENEAFVENFARMEQWLADGIDVAGETYVEFIEKIYQENELYRNELHLGDRHVDLRNIDMPVLQIVAEYDHLVPPTASKPFNEVIASQDTEIKEFSTGHIGMSVSRRSHEELWPEVCDWFEERSQVEDDVEGVRESAEASAERASGAQSTSEADVESGDDLQTLDGIGPTYAERLHDAEIDSKAALADADVAVLAEQTEIPEARIERWIDQIESSG